MTRQSKKGLRIEVGLANCGTATRTHMWKLMGDQGSFSRSACTDSSQLPVSSLPGPESTTSPWEICVLLSGRKNEGREPFWHLLFLKCLQLRIINRPKWVTFSELLCCPLATPTGIKGQSCLENRQDFLSCLAFLHISSLFSFLLP